MIDKATAITGGHADSVYSGNITVTPGDASTVATYQIADITTDYEITHRTDTAANWLFYDPILAKSEF